MSSTTQDPEILDLAFVRGDEFSRRFAFSGDVTDVSDWTITAQVRPFAESTTAWDFAVDMSDAANGNVDITLVETQTAEMPERNEWDFQVVVDGYTLTMFAGAVTCKRDVTRAP